MIHRIFLTGMPGSGKTTIGRQLSKETGIPFYDLDEIIVSTSGKSINEIFNDLGEDGFRQIESKCLNEFIASHSNYILATGGGTPCFFNNIKVINSSGTSIYLKISVKELFNRLKRKIAHRPLLKDKSEQQLLDEIQDKLKARDNFYKLSTYTVEGDSINIQHIMPLLKEQTKR